MGNRLELSEYMPKSELRVAEHLLEAPSFPVIDAHTHFGKLVMGEGYADQYDTRRVVDKLRSYGITNVVNLDGGSGAELDRMLKKTEGFGDFFATFGNVDVARLDEAGFERYVVSTLTQSKKKGIKGLKFWKNISLVLKDKSGRHIPVDDRRLEVIWKTAAELSLPVLIHIADPVAFFKPADRFNERFEELNAHPDWSFCSPGLYSFEELMEMQDRLIEHNPQTTFIVAHVGSHAEDLAAVSKRLDRYKNMYVDIADRIGELGRQPYTAAEFFRRYADRVLFGTDATPLYCDSYRIYYRWLETKDEYFDYGVEPVPRQGRWKIYGLGLDKDILRKVYRENARRLIFEA